MSPYPRPDTNRTEFMDGLRECLPVLGAVVPFHRGMVLIHAWSLMPWAWAASMAVCSGSHEPERA